MGTPQETTNEACATGPSGFTLTELAIVLTVIGIITGGLFALGSSARYRLEVNQGSDELGTIVANMRALYTAQNSSAVSATAASAGFEQELIAQGVFPSEMACGLFACNPWDQSAPNGSAQISLVPANGSNPSELQLEFLNLPADVCADLLVRDSTPGPETGLLAIGVGGQGPTPPTSAKFVFNPALNVYTLPVTPIAAAAACVPGSTYNISWFYTLGG